MVNACYLTLVLLVAFFAIVIGFRRGLTGQLSSLLGFGFGAVAARVFTPEFSQYFHWVDPWSQSPEFQEFTSNLVCGISIYIVVYILFLLISAILQSAMSVIQVGMFNRIVGSLFSLVKNLLWLSIFLNLFLCFSAESRLLRYERSNDGNLVAAVMDMTSVFLGCYSAEDFAHYHQLKEAKKISRIHYIPTPSPGCNFKQDWNVIIS